MLHIQNFLRTTENGLEILAEPPYSLKIKEKGDLVLFNYNQIESNPYNPITKEARGLVLEKGTWNVVRYGFNRFFNLGEEPADKIDFASATATSKEDGTLIFLYYYDSEWHIGTRGTFDADEAELESAGFKNFRELFDEVLAAYPDFNWDRLNPRCTYCMELCSVFNKVVIDYPEPRLFYILTRDNETFEELECDIGIPKPAYYVLDNEEDYKALVESFGTNHEGIVIKDKDNHRVKLKTLAYFELHRMVQNHKIDEAAALSMILTGEDKELLAYFPELSDFFQKVGMQYDEMFAILSDIQDEVNYWKVHNSSAQRKDFADYVRKVADEVRCMNYYFLAYDNKLQAKVDSIKDDAKQLIKFLRIKVSD